MYIRISPPPPDRVRIKGGTGLPETPFRTGRKKETFGNAAVSSPPPPPVAFFEIGKAATTQPSTPATRLFRHPFVLVRSPLSGSFKPSNTLATSSLPLPSNR
ncbi:hypothetical protein XA68_18378 [Ophiocordyceps unilateralis]|uniref:Uncharacterized protein n=1 Tax=Ophiocordyceps unilateralis TaxID=268505 RepID=A0A2A9P241_OPHUN|nr:hypothetical protein XA68_18378 [Ophiocordyceps unilateralis]